MASMLQTGELKFELNREAIAELPAPERLRCCEPGRNPYISIR